MISITKDRSKDLTRLTVTEEFVPSEMIDATEKFYATEPTQLAMWNLLEAKGNSFTSEDIDRILVVIRKYADKRIGGKTVLVVSSDYAYGMSRIHEAKAENTGIKIDYHVTRSVSRALKWLGIED